MIHCTLPATVAGMEGALILCRAKGGIEPLDAMADEILRLLPAPGSSGGGH